MEGIYLAEPNIEKYSRFGSGNGLTWAFSSMQGWRKRMEDTHCTTIGITEDLTDWSFFAVLDGHRGVQASIYGHMYLLDTIVKNEDFKNNCTSEKGIEDVEGVKKGIKNGFLELDEKLKEIRQMHRFGDGSTAVCILISPTHLYFANCGDSRAVLSRSRGVCFATKDHKPLNPVEKERIHKAGGCVKDRRVNGDLALSRALGDFSYKKNKEIGPCEQLISPEPDVDARERNNQLDEFLILACDGVWDVMDNDDLCDYIRAGMRNTSDLVQLCESVLDKCLKRVIFETQIPLPFLYLFIHLVNHFI